MSVRVEWQSAAGTIPEVLRADDDWVGAGDQDPDSFALCLSENEVLAIEGTLPELAALAKRITRVVDDAVQESLR